MVVTDYFRCCRCCSSCYCNCAFITVFHWKPNTQLRHRFFSRSLLSLSLSSLFVVLSDPWPTTCIAQFAHARDVCASVLHVKLIFVHTPKARWLAPVHWLGLTATPMNLNIVTVCTSTFNPHVYYISGHSVEARPTKSTFFLPMKNAGLLVLIIRYKLTSKTQTRQWDAQTQDSANWRAQVLL